MKNLLFTLLALFYISNSLFSNKIDSISYYLNNYQPEKALTLINRNIIEEPNNASLYYLKARAHKNVFAISEAIIAVEDALNLDSLSFASWFLAAELYNMAGKLNESVSAYKVILAIDSTNMQANFKIANMYYKTEKFSRAAFHYGKVTENDKTNWYALRRLAKSFEKLNFPSELTVPKYYEVLELNPDDKISKHRITMIYLGEKKYREAVDASNGFLKTDSLNTKILSLNGYGCLQLHEQDSAITSFDKCLALKDSSFFNLKYIGLAYYNKRKYLKSIDYLEKAYKKSNLDPYTNFYLGASWARSIDKYKGIEYLNETIELLQPNEEFLSKTYTELGVTYASIEKHNEAVEAYNLAYEYNERNTDLYYSMGVYYLNKENELAKKYLEMYIDSTLKNDENSLKAQNCRRISERMLERIEEDKFWNGDK